jgi:hypothetical protein
LYIKENNQTTAIIKGDKLDFSFFYGCVSGLILPALNMKRLGT